jgi:methylase of polypeptide subunit release factors
MSTHPPPTFPTSGARASVRACLSGARFNEASLRRRLEVPEGAPFASLGARLVGERVRALDEPTRTVLELFLLEREVPRAAADQALGADALGALDASGLLHVTGDRCAATARLGAVGELIVASDLTERHRARDPDFVLGAGGATRRFADLTMRRRVASVLDLGCGAGVLSALAAAHAARVVATDVNARALAFARFNAELNEVEGLEFREGSLYEPVEGERFDLIVCNPPFAISPAGTFVYRDGGTALSRAIARAGPDHLTPSGWMQMMAEWPERVGTDWREEVRAWLDDVACDAWVLRLYTHDAATYAWRWVMQDAPDRDGDEALRTWVEHLRALGVDAVGGGLIVLRPRRFRHVVRELQDAPPLADGPVGDALRRWLAAQDLLSAGGDLQGLLDAPLDPAPTLERVDTSEPTGSGWTRPEVRLRLRDGLRFAAGVDPVASALVGLLGNGRTPREALQAFADARGVPAEPFLSGLPALLHRLVSLGILVPAGERSP